MSTFRLSSATLLTAALAAAGPSAHGAAPLQAVNAEPIILENFVVTASPLSRSQADLAQSTAVLSGQALAQQQRGTLGATLANEVGLSATDFGPGASRPVIRGIGGDRVRVLENGVGTLDVSNISPDHGIGTETLFADRIEVVRGPATLRYGSAAIGGVVNVLDARLPTERTTAALSGRSELRGNTADEERAGALLLNGGTSCFAWQTRAFARRTGDLRIPGTNLHQHDETAHDHEEDAEHEHELEAVHGRVPNTAIDSEGWSAGGTWFWRTGFLGAAFTAHNSLFGIPPGGHVHEHEEEEGHEEAHEEHDHEAEPIRSDLHQRRVDVRGAITEPFGPFARADLELAFADYDHTELEGEAVGTRFDQTGREGRLELTQQAYGDLTGALGAQYQFTELKAAGDEAYLPTVRTTNWAGFAFEELVTGPVAWQAGARYEHQRVAPVAGSGFVARSFEGLSGSLGAVWSFAENWGLAASVARTERLPSATELFADGPHAATAAYELGAPSLHKERATSAELSLRRRTGLVTGVVTAFRSQFDGYIFEQATGATADGLPVYAFVDCDARFQGGELETWWHLHEGQAHALDLRLAADWVRATQLDADQPLPRIPPHRYLAGLHYRGGAFTAGIDATHACAQRRTAPGEEATDGYTLLSADVGYRFTVGRTEYLVFLRGTNLADAEARNHVSFLKEYAPLAGRSLTAGVRLTF
ncbi:MAG: TonB-dependent receptor [Opitutaceae bacterium]|nr:TonB-dependent receptor [Opitutaceae bacterium]